MPPLHFSRNLFFTLIAFTIVSYTFIRLPQMRRLGVLQANKQGFPLKFRARPESLRNIQNTTLGFQKIFVLNLPERPDKLDAFALASSLTGFTAETLVGVHGDVVQNKTLPSMDKLYAPESSRNNVVGCWRAHMNFARKIVTDCLTSALIMEDDADWSIFLKHQLALFAEGAQYILSSSSSTFPHSPYGDDWDLLWLGHCGGTIKSSNPRRFLIENDNTVPIPNHRVVYADKSINEGEEGLDNHTRLVYKADLGLCTYAYALSAAGAKKILSWMAAATEFYAIDTGLRAMCSESILSCVSVYPTLIDTHKAVGKVEADSDIAPPDGDSVRTEAYTPNIVHSQRLNIDRAIRGDEVGDGREWRQWADEPMVHGLSTTRTVFRQAPQT